MNRDHSTNQKWNQSETISGIMTGRKEGLDVGNDLNTPNMNTIVNLGSIL